MSSVPPGPGDRPGEAVPLEVLVARAREGDAEALESVVLAIQPDVYRLALRFLWHPQDAEDATQDIVLKVITRLAGFRGDSSFRTWVYRVASNALITMKKGKAEGAHLSFDEFGEDLLHGLSDAPVAEVSEVDRSLLMEEVKIGCTTAMLLCLDRAHRLAYVLGEILGLDHVTAAEALEISPANYRKRLSRARSQVTDLMRRRCGLFEPGNPCRCRRRVKTAVDLGRLDPERLLFASSREKAAMFPEVLAEIRSLDDFERAAALYRSQDLPGSKVDVVGWLKDVLRSGQGGEGRWMTWN